MRRFLSHLSDLSKSLVFCSANRFFQKAFNFETGAGASGDAIFVQQSAGSPEATEAHFNYLAPQYN